MPFCLNQLILYLRSDVKYVQKSRTYQGAGYYKTCYLREPESFAQYGDKQHQRQDYKAYPDAVGYREELLITHFVFLCYEDN